jgi:hypothetical protein
MQEKKALLFLKKKQQKDFCESGPGVVSWSRSQEQTFFAALFFKKATACFSI